MRSRDEPRQRSLLPDAGFELGGLHREEDDVRGTVDLRHIGDDGSRDDDVPTSAVQHELLPSGAPVEPGGCACLV
jgi:hypothetical protein